MGDHDTMQRAPLADARASDDDARQVVQALADARAAEKRARAARERFIVEQYQRGARQIDIARQLAAFADGLGLNGRERQQFGCSEGTVRITLRVAGLK